MALGDSFRMGKLDLATEDKVNSRIAAVTAAHRVLARARRRDLRPPAYHALRDLIYVMRLRSGDFDGDGHLDLPR